MGGMTHTYWNCFRCHWCWMSLPLQANKKETPIQNTPLRGHMQHKLKCARSETESCQPRQATGGLPHPGHQLGSTAPILMFWPPPPCPQSPLSLPSPSIGTKALFPFIAFSSSESSQLIWMVSKSCLRTHLLRLMGRKKMDRDGQ